MRQKLCRCSPGAPAASNERSRVLPAASGDFAVWWPAPARWRRHGRLRRRRQRRWPRLWPRPQVTPPCSIAARTHPLRSLHDLVAPGSRTRAAHGGCLLRQSAECDVDGCGVGCCAARHAAHRLCGAAAPATTAVHAAVPARCVAAGAPRTRAAALHLRPAAPPLLPAAKGPSSLIPAPFQQPRCHR